MAYLTVFALAAFVGIEVVSKVPSILHTPLMSGSNAIHGIVLVGALTIMGEAHGAAGFVLGLRSPSSWPRSNIVGGFVVTDRMLEMFKAKPGRAPGQGQSGGGGGQGRREPRPARPARGAADDRAVFTLATWRPRLPGRHHRLHPGPQGPELAQARPAGEPDRCGRRHLGGRLHLLRAGAAPMGRTWCSPWWPWPSGRSIAVPAARMVKMTAMPQMVAIFNGVGGGAAALVSIVELLHLHAPAPTSGHVQSPRCCSAC